MKSDPADLDDNQLSALLDWKRRKGRSWKNELLFAWQNGRDEQDPRGASLRWIRNHRGPSWLVDLKRKKRDDRGSPSVGYIRAGTRLSQDGAEALEFGDREEALAHAALVQSNTAERITALGPVPPRLGLDHHRVEDGHAAVAGCRRGEIVDLQWPDVRGNRLHLRDSKNGARVVWLGDDARALIDTLPRPKKKDGPWLFVTSAGSHITPGMVDSRWAKLRDAAGLRRVRLHDLRHTFASHAAMSEEPLPMIGKLLGHATVKSTARYAHLDDTHLIGAAQKIGDAIEAMMLG